MNIEETVYIVDAERWNVFVKTVPSFQTFQDSMYYLHACNQTQTTFLVAAGIDNNIAIVNNVSAFLVCLCSESEC